MWKAFDIVARAKGVYVHGLAEKTGRRYMKTDQKMGHGGPRTAGDPDVAYLKKTEMMHNELRGLMTAARYGMPANNVTGEGDMVVDEAVGEVESSVSEPVAI